MGIIAPKRASRCTRIGISADAAEGSLNSIGAPRGYSLLTPGVTVPTGSAPPSTGNNSWD